VYIIVSCLTNFIKSSAQENVQPLVPHLHLVFNYVLLRLDSNEGPNLVRLLGTVLIAAQRLMATMNSTNEERYQWSESFTTLLSLCKTGIFKLRWLCKEQTTPITSLMTLSPLGIISDDNFYTLSLQHLQLHLNSGLRTSEESTTPLLHTSVTRGVPVDVLLAVLCEVGKALKCSELCVHWAHEALLWSIDYKDTTLSTKALELYRLLLDLPMTTSESTSTTRSVVPTNSQVHKMSRALEETLTTLGHAVTEVVTMMTSMTITHPLSWRLRLSSQHSHLRRPALSLLLTPPVLHDGSASTPTSPRTVVSSGRSKDKDKDKDSGRTSPKFPPGSPISTTAPAAPVFPQQQITSSNAATPLESSSEADALLPRTVGVSVEKITLNTVRVRTLIQVWTCLIPHFVRSTPLLYLYWTSVALLQLSPFIYSHIFQDTLRLLRGLLHSSVFLQKVAIPHDDKQQQQQQQHAKAGSFSSLYSQLLTLARSSWGYKNLAFLVSKVRLLRFVVVLFAVLMC
jgi:hypothetical protein